MRNAICVDTKISIEWPYCSFLYCDVGAPSRWTLRVRIPYMFCFSYYFFPYLFSTCTVTVWRLGLGLGFGTFGFGLSCLFYNQENPQIVLVARCSDGSEIALTPVLMSSLSYQVSTPPVNAFISFIMIFSTTATKCTKFHLMSLNQYQDIEHSSLICQAYVFY